MSTSGRAPVVRAPVVSAPVVRVPLVRVLTVMLVALAAATVTAPAPARAHGDDPTLVAQLTEVRPALPPGVLVQVRTGLSEQMLVANPTGTPLTVLDPDGVEFLRISSAGVFGNLNARYLHATANPPDAPVELPPIATGAEPRWRELSGGSAWGWFERRLHPFVPGAEPDRADADSPVLASWQVGMRYGDRPVTAVGVLERRPITGTFRVTADPGDDRVEVGIGQGKLPAVQLRILRGRRVTVGGGDGVPFLRIDDGGVAANPASVHYPDNPQFHGRQAMPDGWVRIGEGRVVTWLDARLRYPADRPPDRIESGDEVVELGRWQIPVTVDGRPRTVSGRVEWVPTALAGPPPSAGFPWITVGLGIGAAVLLAAVVLRSREWR